MKQTSLYTMRDVFIEELCARMYSDERIFFVSADFGAPSLDQLRAEFKDRFINVGIAEQNLISICTGLALEGYIVYAYGIAPFISMRDYEQIRTNLGLLSQTRALNVNLISVGAGISYDVSGPTHHCIEDISIIRTLPNIAFFSPSDWVLTKRFVDYSLDVNSPKYMRLDGKNLPNLYDESFTPDFESGFYGLIEGGDICFVTTGYATHMALQLQEQLCETDINTGVIDIFLLKPLDEEGLANALRKYKYVITMEEGFGYKGGLDSMIAHLINTYHIPVQFDCFGFKDSYYFNNGGRAYLQKLYGLDKDVIISTVHEWANEK